MAALAVPTLLALGAAVRALRFAGGFATPWPWDETSPATQAVYLLGGDFPVNWLGVEYLGASPAYPLAAWFAVAGRSTFALDVFAYAAGLAVLGTSYLVARRLQPRPAALLTLAVLAVPPLLLAKRSLDGSLSYQFLLVLGNVVLLLTHRLFFRRPGDRRTILALGLTAGVGWWTHSLVVVYLAPFGLLALRTGLAWRARIWLFAAGALLGSLPAWLYDVGHYPTARFMVHDTGWAGADPFPVRATAVLGTFVPAIFGLRPAAVRLASEGIVALPALLVGAGAVLRAAVRDRAALTWAVGIGRRPETGAALLLWGVFAANMALVLFTARGGVGERYLIPLYSVLPLWLGELLAWLWATRRPLGGTAAAALLGFHLWANVTDTLGATPPAARRWRPLEASIQPLVRWLEDRGIRGVYWDVPDLAPHEFTFLTGGRIVASDLWREPAPSHAHLVDATLAPPIVTVPNATELEPLRDTLRGIGMAVREHDVGRFWVVETVRAAGVGFAPIAPDHWVVRASDDPEAARHLVDRDVSTGWHGGAPQAPGQWVSVDLGREETLARVDFLAIDWQDVPAGFRVEVSSDGTSWREVASVPHYWGPFFFAGQHPFLRVRRGRIQASFAPVRTRFVRVVETGVASLRAWAAREIVLYRPAPPAPPPPEPGALTAALRREGVEWVYADPWFAAVVQAESRGTIRSQESNLYLNAYGRDLPGPARLDQFRAETGRAILLGADADADGIRTALAGQRIPVRETAIGPYRLLVLAGPPAPARRLVVDGWSATTSVAAEGRWQPIDGDPATAWTSPGPAGPETSFTLDLRKVRNVSRVRVRPGARDGGAADLWLEGSTDDVRFAPLGPLAWAGPLYWTGWELLRNGLYTWEVTFPPARLRYLRLRPAVAQARPWVVAEVECFE